MALVRIPDASGATQYPPLRASGTAISDREGYAGAPQRAFQQVRAPLASGFWRQYFREFGLPAASDIGLAHIEKRGHALGLLGEFEEQGGVNVEQRQAVGLAAVVQVKALGVGGVAWESAVFRAPDRLGRMISRPSLRNGEGKTLGRASSEVRIGGLGQGVEEGAAGLRGESDNVGKLVAVEAQVEEEVHEPGSVVGLGHAVLWGLVDGWAKR